MNTAVQQQAPSALTVKDDPKTFPGMLTAFKAQIAMALPKHITADRMARIALTAYRLNQTLAKCPPASVFAAVIQSAQLGLEVGLNGRAYLVPYYNNKKNQYECQFIPGWKGLVELANRTGRSSVWTGAVFDGDQFDYQLGDNPYVTHRPGLEDDPEKLLFVYAVGRIKGNEYPVIEVWSIEKIKKHLKRYNRQGDKHYAFTNMEMYARKIPLLQVLKYMPSSPELEAAIAMEHAADKGAQELNISDAIEGSFMPPQESEGNGGEDAGAGNGADQKKEAPKRGASGLKDALTSKKPPEQVDKATGEVTTGPTFAQISDKVNKAASQDDFDACADLIRSLPDEGQRGELQTILNERIESVASQA